MHYLKTYGSDKVLFGTNFPQLSLAKAVEQVEGLGAAGRGAREVSL